MLDVGSGSHAQQTARVMERLEPVLAGGPSPTWCWCRATSTRRWPPRSWPSSSGIPVAHVEAGTAQLRPHDARGDQPHRHRPDLRPPLPPPRGARSRTCGARAIADERIHFVGNTMIDTLVALRGALPRRSTRPGGIGLEPGGYLARDAAPPRARRRTAAGATRSRAARRSRRELPVVFPGPPAHAQDARRPRGPTPGSCASIDPVGYLDFLSLAGRRRRACSPTPAASRRRRRTSASRASRCATTPSAR